MMLAVKPKISSKNQTKWRNLNTNRRFTLCIALKNAKLNKNDENKLS
jgi:hypothetical protein